jgi:hypothetical protein
LEAATLQQDDGQAGDVTLLPPVEDAQDAAAPGDALEVSAPSDAVGTSVAEAEPPSFSLSFSLDGPSVSQETTKAPVKHRDKKFKMAPVPGWKRWR